ncbi:MAG TPA: hypothetical protein VF310_14775 [Vicinamibacteria bacterium]
MTAVLTRSAAAAALLCLLCAAPAAAQGKGKGLGKTKNKTPRAGAGAAGDPTVAVTGVRQFGVWLDDATLSPRGQGWATFGVGYTRALFGHQWDFPSVDAGLGLSRRVQVGITAPVSHTSYLDGTGTRGVGDLYLSAKVGLVDPEAKGRTFGVATVPTIEVLASGSVVEGAGRVFWVLPVTLERRFAHYRAYGTAGYFSRGAVFASGALEIPLDEKVTVTATLSHTHSLDDDPTIDPQSPARSRWDLSGGAVYFLKPTATLYLSLGRTVSRMDANASSLSLGAGVSLGFQHRIGSH